MIADTELSLWRKKQIALLYHFTSLEYLKSLDMMVDDLMLYADVVLSAAQRERRDELIANDRWGMRDTAENWGNYGWPFLIDFKRSLLRHIADRSSQIYHVSGANFFARGTAEMSLQWTTPAEEDQIEQKMKQISNHATYMDESLRREPQGGKWSDYGLTRTWNRYCKDFPRLPRFQLRPDVEAVTGQVPPLTGVYVPQSDPHGVPQFAWSGGDKGKLLECQTFSEVGLVALKAVGRRELWLNEPQMYAYATLPKNRARFKEDMSMMGKFYPDLASYAVAMQASTTRACKWYLVELVDGEYEDYDDSTIPGVVEERGRVLGGERCPKAGYYSTLAKDKSRRYFEVGELMPDFQNSWGTVIWQLSE